MKENHNCRIVAGKKFQVQLYDIMKYLADISPQAAQNMRKVVNENINLLKLFPQLGKPIEQGAYGERRVLIIKKYIILYTYRNAEIHLDMILDEKQDYYNYI